MNVKFNLIKYKYNTILHENRISIDIMGDKSKNTILKELSKLTDEAQAVVEKTEDQIQEST